MGARRLILVLGLLATFAGRAPAQTATWVPTAAGTTYSWNVNTNPPWVTSWPFIMSSRSRIDTTAWPKSARSTTMPSRAEARSRCIIFRSGTRRAYTY